MMMMINKWSLPDVPPAPPKAKALIEREKEPEPEPEPVFEFRRNNTKGELIYGPEPKPAPPAKPIPSNDPSKVETLRLRVDAADAAPSPQPPIYAALQAYKEAADQLPMSMKVDIIKDGYLETPFAGRGEERWAGGGGRLGYAAGGYQSGAEAAAANGKLDSYTRQRKELATLDADRPLPKTISGVLTDIWNDTIERLNVEMGIEDFWSQYNWQSADAAARIKRRPEHEAPQSKAEQSALLLADDPDWTKESVETLLRTVGVECSYKTGSSLRATGRWMLMHRDFFLLRSQSALRWDHDGEPNFLTNFNPGKHDRVFGGMVEQVAKEEQKKKEELEAKAKAENGGVKSERAKAAEAKTQSHNSQSDGKAADADDGATDKPVVLRGEDAGKTDVAPGDVPAVAKAAVKPVEQANAEVKAAAREIVKEEEMNAVKAAEAKAAPGKPLAMEDIAAAFGNKEEKIDGPLIWGWRDITERWRWFVYDASGEMMKPGGWEERDWKVFGKPGVEGEGVEDVFEPRVVDIADPASYEWGF